MLPDSHTSELRSPTEKSIKGVDIFYAGLGGGGDFGGARFFSAWIWGGTISLEKVLGGHDFLFTIAIQKKNYIIFFIYRYSGIIFCP